MFGPTSATPNASAPTIISTVADAPGKHEQRQTRPDEPEADRHLQRCTDTRARWRRDHGLRQ